MRTLGPQSLHSGSRTQHRAPRPLAPPPSSGVAQPVAPLPEAAGGGHSGCVRARESPQPSGVDAAPPGCGPTPRWPCSGRRRSALWGLRIDRRFQCPGTRPLRCSFVPDSWALSLQAGSPLHFPVFSWQKGISLVFSKTPPHRPWVGSNHQPLPLTAKRANRLRYGDSSTSLFWSLWS